MHSAPHVTLQVVPSHADEHPALEHVAEHDPQPRVPASFVVLASEEPTVQS